jgi:hypothetical protein
MNGEKSHLQIKIENHYLRNSIMLDNQQWYIGFAQSGDAIGSDIKGKNRFKCWENEEGDDLKKIREYFINQEKFLDAELDYTTTNQKVVFIYQA